MLPVSREQGGGVASFSDAYSGLKLGIWMEVKSHELQRLGISSTSSGDGLGILGWPKMMVSFVRSALVAETCKESVNPKSLKLEVNKYTI